VNVYEAHASSLAQLQDELDATGDAVHCPIFTWAALDRRALPGGAKLRKDLEVGGFSPDADLAIVCRIAQFGSTPNALRDSMLNTRLTYLGHEYRIRDVTIAAGGLQLRILCVDAEQSA
jgi:hypothetical protein